MEDCIVAQGLTKRFGQIIALRELTLNVKRGEIFGLVGPDGAGKTTTLRILSSIMAPTKGEAWVAGHHVVKEAEAVKEKIGYMSQRFGLYQDLTVMENLDFYADLYGVSKAQRQERMERLLSFSNLKPFKKRLAGQLSGGMKQKLGLCCALIHTPEVLFLDEPTNGVDPVSRREFWHILYQLVREGVTILLSTSYLDEAERCSRVGFIHRGLLVATGTPEEVKRLMTRTILEVRVERTRRAMAILGERLTEECVSLFGDKIHVVTSLPEKTANLIRDALAGEGIPVLELRTADPTLEDAFVSVVNQETESAFRSE